jgi:predicted dinucleotide-binding enzyme
MTHERAAAAADVVVLALPGDQVRGLIADLGAALRDTVVIDATNNTAGPVMNSVTEIADARATVFRAFNSVGWEQMQRPAFGTLRADMPFAGPWTAAGTPPVPGGAELVAGLIGDIGFRPIDLGTGSAALEAVDGLARLWFLLAFGRGYGRRVGFRILTADDETGAAG